MTEKVRNRIQEAVDNCKTVYVSFKKEISEIKDIEIIENGNNVYVNMPDYFDVDMVLKTLTYTFKGYLWSASYDFIDCEYYIVGFEDEPTLEKWNEVDED